MHEPQNLNDIIFGNPESKLRIYDIVTGAEALPHCGKSAIILYGTWGTGKTTMAKMLPNAIEKGRTDSELVMPEEMIRCQQGYNGPQVIEFISKILDKNSLNTSGLHYIIIDEVDLLTKSAQESLKSALNTNRCILVEMNAAKVDQLLPLAQQIAVEQGITITDEELIATIKAANGSFRNITHNVERLVRRRNIPTNIIF